MDIGIGLVFELPCHEPAMCLGKLDALVDHAHTALRGGSYNDLRAKEPHQLASLDAEWFCHGDDKWISLGCANHGKTDSRISARRLYHRLAGLEFSRLFRGFDYPKRQSVLHRTKGVGGFDLHEKVHALRRQTIDPHHWGVAD